MASSMFNLTVYSNDGQTVLYSGQYTTSGSEYITITQSGFYSSTQATTINISYGTNIQGWSTTVNALTPTYNINTQYEGMEMFNGGEDSVFYIVLQNKFVSSVGLGVLVDKIKSKQNAITSTNKLSADLIADGTTNKVVTATDISVWNGKQNAITSTNKLDYSLIANTPTIPTTTSSVTSGSTAALTSGGAYTALAGKQDTITSTNKLDYSLIDNTPTIPSAVTSINGLSGGTLTSPLTLTGGDAATASKIILNTNGQITDTGTATLFGRSGTGSTLIVGHSSYAMTMRGSATRPTYNGSNMALSSDIPTDTGATSITTSGTGNAVTTASYNASTRQITLTKGSTFLTSAPVTSVAGLTGAITASNLLAQLVTLSLNGNNCVNGNYLKTLTSYARFVSNGSVKWGIEFGTYGNTSSDIQTANITFANSYSVPPSVIASMYWESGTREYTVRNLTTSGCKIYANGATRGFFYIAIGRLS